MFRIERMSHTLLSFIMLYFVTTVIELLISYRAKLDLKALLSVINYYSRGGLPVMRCLINYSMDINAPIKEFDSPLYYAVHIVGSDQTRLLLDRGADRSIKNHSSETPLAMARSK